MFDLQYFCPAICTSHGFSVKFSCCVPLHGMTRKAPVFEADGFWRNLAPLCGWYFGNFTKTTLIERLLFSIRWIQKFNSLLRWKTTGNYHFVIRKFYDQFKVYWKSTNNEDYVLYYSGHSNKVKREVFRFLFTSPTDLYLWIPLRKNESNYSCFCKTNTREASSSCWKVKLWR